MLIGEGGKEKGFQYASLNTLDPLKNQIIDVLQNVAESDVFTPFQN